MKKKKITKILTDNDREFILKFFNMALQFKQPKNEFDIDAHLKKNFSLFIIFCDFMYANKDRYEDLKHRLKKI